MLHAEFSGTVPGRLHGPRASLPIVADGVSKFCRAVAWRGAILWDGCRRVLQGCQKATKQRAVIVYVSKIIYSSTRPVFAQETPRYGVAQF